jgi:hypothetical protein
LPLQADKKTTNTNKRLKKTIFDLFISTSNDSDLENPSWHSGFTEEPNLPDLI